MARHGRSVVVPGNHDGVHVGHRALIAAARDYAAPRGLDVVALTFAPHPLVTLAPERAPDVLTTVERRTELLVAAGADRVVVHRFDAEYAQKSPEEFVESVLVRELDASAVIVGPDFQFGAGRSGSLDRLRELGSVHGIDVVEVAPVASDGARASSTRIREALRSGDVESATRMLGRVPEVEGAVVQGQRRGRTLGFPTANLEVDRVLLPRNGVYAVLARALTPAPGPLLRGVANLGTRPTVAAGFSLEVHLFDLDADLYGERLRVGFVARLREEKKFESIEALRVQIGADAAAARKRLDREEPSWRWI